jgi:predicted phosphoribosyltransferase
VPVGAADAVAAMRAECDEVVCLETPADFRAVAIAYAEFGQTPDAEVVALLGRAARELAAERAAERPGGRG